jgi:putative spermidine/putrescine transport system ATP-binding protein
MTQALILEHLTAHYGATRVLDDLSLTVPAGELVSLLGASGCGKTTTLRLVAGFLEPTAGTITLGGKDLTRLPAHRRDIGLVFQSYALFPHLSVADNVGFGLKQRGVSGPDRAQRVADMLARVGLDHLADRLPGALSGGQRQRVAIARALAVEPDLLVFDEPTSALDVLVQARILEMLARLRNERGITYLFISHDLAVVDLVCDEVIVLQQGRIVEQGDPDRLFKDPQHPYTQRLLAAVPGRDAIPQVLPTTA